MLKRTPLTLAIMALLTPLPAGAECFVLTGKFVMAEKSIDLVFSGRVVETTRTAELGYRVTFDVARVWKGAVPKRFDVYVWELAPEMPRFDRGKDQHIVLA